MWPFTKQEAVKVKYKRAPRPVLTALLWISLTLNAVGGFQVWAIATKGIAISYTPQAVQAESDMVSQLVSNEVNLTR